MRDLDPSNRESEERLSSFFSFSTGEINVKFDLLSSLKNSGTQRGHHKGLGHELGKKQ
jgi:hypothetical protein